MYSWMEPVSEMEQYQEAMDYEFNARYDYECEAHAGEMLDYADVDYTPHAAYRSLPVLGCTCTCGFALDSIPF